MNYLFLVLIIVAIIVLIGIIASGYVKAPPDTAFIISGLRKNSKTVIGKATVKIPFLEWIVEQLPAIAEAIGKAYINVDKIYMYGDQSTQLTADILSNVTQVSEGLSESLGIDIKSMLALVC